jgi:hypothetical protein
MASGKVDRLLDFLMNAVSVTALLSMVALIGVQSHRGLSRVSEARSDRPFHAMRAALAEVAEREALYYLDALEFADSPEALHFVGTEGVAVALSSSEEGWAATASHEGLGREEGCAVFFGAVAPPEFPVRPSVPGEVACSE